MTALRRLLVALDAGRHDRSWLGPAAELAARLRADVRLLLVEDLDLRRAADLPFVREIDLLTTGAAAFDVATIESRLRRLARTVHDVFASAATRQHVAWTFEVVRGRLRCEVAAAGTGADLLVLPHRPPTSARGRIVALWAGAAGEDAALRRAHELAGGAAFDVVAVGQSPEQARRLEADLRGDAATRHTALLRLPSCAASDLRTLRRHPIDLAVLAASAALALPLDPATLADALGRPVLLVPS